MGEREACVTREQEEEGGWHHLTKQTGSGNGAAEREGCESSGTNKKDLVSNLLKMGWDQEGLQKAKEDEFLTAL